MSKNLYRTYNTSGKIIECTECSDTIDNGDRYWRRSHEYYNPVEAICKPCMTKRRVVDAL